MIKEVRNKFIMKGKKAQTLDFISYICKKGNLKLRSQDGRVSKSIFNIFLF